MCAKQMLNIFFLVPPTYLVSPLCTIWMLLTVMFMKVNPTCFAPDHLSTYPDTFLVNRLIRIHCGLDLSLLFSTSHAH